MAAWGQGRAVLSAAAVVCCGPPSIFAFPPLPLLFCAPNTQKKSSSTQADKWWQRSAAQMTTK